MNSFQSFYWSVVDKFDNGLWMLVGIWLMSFLTLFLLACFYLVVWWLSREELRYPNELERRREVLRENVIARDCLRWRSFWSRFWRRRSYEH